jgi:hypothetical protein
MPQRPKNAEQPDLRCGVEAKPERKPNGYMCQLRSIMAEQRPEYTCEKSAGNGRSPKGQRARTRAEGARGLARMVDLSVKNLDRVGVANHCGPRGMV